MRTGETSFIAPFRYTAMIWAIGLGVVIFNDWPDNMTVLGTLIVVVTVFIRSTGRKYEEIADTAFNVFCETF